MGIIHSLRATHRPLEITIGEGFAGRKTLALRADRSRIEKDFYYPDHIALTNGFFARFLWECGALKETDYYTKQEKINNGKFTPEESGQIRDAVMSLHPLLRNALMIRSDDWAVGIGLETSLATCIPYELRRKKEGEELLLQRVEDAVKAVIASQFNPNAQAFKRLKGIKERSGVQIMPFWGETIGMDFSCQKEDCILPVISLNVLGPVNGYYLSSLGAGIGGANNDPSMVKFEKGINARRGIKIGGAKLLRINTGEAEEMRIENRLDEMNYFMGRMQNYGEIENWIYDLTCNTGPRYLEIVKDDLIRPLWVVVQSAPIYYKPIERPEINKERILFESEKCAGSAVVGCDNLVYYDGEISTLKNWQQMPDAQSRDNILIIDCKWQTASILRRIDLSKIENTKGIIIIATDIYHIFQSHLNGYMRELNIPIIGVETGIFDRAASEKKRVELINKLRNGGKITIYCNEFVNDGEGFVATEK